MAAWLQLRGVARRVIGRRSPRPLHRPRERGALGQGRGAERLAVGASQADVGVEQQAEDQKV